MTNAELLCRVLVQMDEAGKPLAVHEFDWNALCISENNLATRLSEWAKRGLVVGNWRKGAGYKEWVPGKGEVPARKPKPIPAAVVGARDALPGFQVLTVSIPPSLEGRRISWRVEAVPV